MSLGHRRMAATLRLAAAWIVVTIPLTWGVSQTVRKSLALFSPTAPARSEPGPIPKTRPTGPEMGWKRSERPRRIYSTIAPAMKPIR